MSLPKGSASKKLRDAIDAATTDLADGVTAAQISDATAAGRAVLTGASPTAMGVPALVSAPSTAASTGTAGQIAYDATHIYVCISSNSWVRATLAAW